MTDLEIVRAVAQDCIDDVKALDGAPFTGRVVAENFGQTLAMVSALALVLEHMILKLDPDVRP